LREKLSSLSEFVREIKVGFTRYYNKRHNRRGYFWGDRFKSVIVEKGETLINCLAYIDLNPIRAGIVERPEDYRWNSLGYHVQTGNKDNFLSLDFGLKEFGVVETEERLKRYRRYVYEAGALDHSGKGQARVIDNDIVEHERENDFELNRIRWKMGGYEAGKVRKGQEDGRSKVKGEKSNKKYLDCSFQSMRDRLVRVCNTI